jgi:hypothetical protein
VSAARTSASPHGARHGEFFAPLPLAFVALLVVNDRWLKPALHSWLTGKLSDVAICFFLPLFVSELLGLVLGISPRRRLWAGALVTVAVFASLEVVPPVTRAAIHALDAITPYVGIHARSRMTSDWSDLLCLACVPCAVRYGKRRTLTAGSTPSSSADPPTRATRCPRSA